MTVYVIGPKDKYDLKKSINTTSSSKNWSRGLSPFLLGPVPLYEGAVLPYSQTMESAWQNSKLYPEHADEEGNPTREHFEWAKKGWERKRAERYPMGKGHRPLCHWWGEPLGYIEARRKIYIPLYAKAVAKTRAFARLREEYVKAGSVTLWDFDGYNHRRMGLTIQEVVRNPDRNMGHAFVLAHLLEKMHPELVKKKSNSEPKLTFQQLLEIF